MSVFYYSLWGILEYYNVMVVGVEEVEDGLVGVCVFYLYFIYKFLKLCLFFLEGKCCFKENCRFFYG